MTELSEVLSGLNGVKTFHTLFRYLDGIPHQRVKRPKTRCFRLVGIGIPPDGVPTRYGRSGRGYEHL